MHDPAAPPAPSLTRDLLTLTKPGITISNVLMAATGYLAVPGVRVGGPLELVALLFGTALVVASANAFNMVLEKDTDALMSRTRHRPVAAGRLGPRPGAAAATLLGLLGTAVLLLASPTVALLGAASVVAYAFIYTPMKRRSPLALPVGAIPGAAPPALGVLTADPSATSLALALSLILFLWQFPHFLAIAVRRRDDYAAAGIRALTVSHGPALTRTLSRITALAMIPVGLAPPILAALGPAAALAITALALTLAVSALRADWVRPTFLASLAYLPALFVVVAARALLA